jgi:Transposase DDE domain
VVAADVITGGNERHRLEPMAEAAETELEKSGIEERPGVALADAGYWNSRQIEALERKGIEVLVPPDADTRRAPSKLRRGGRYRRMRERLARPEAATLYRRRQQMVEPVFAHIKTTCERGASRAAA